MPTFIQSAILLLILIGASATTWANTTSLASSTRIIGGADSLKADWPFMVAITRIAGPATNDGVICGGTLIAPSVVVTAAHCLPYSAKDLKVWVGLWQRSSYLAEAEERYVARVLIHEGYDASIQPKKNDIALLFLDQPSARTPAIIAGIGTETSGKAAGWGTLDSATKVFPDILQEVSLPIVSNEACSNALRVSIEPGMMCAGGELLQDTCTGDSGGPLVIRWKGQIRLAGITSVGPKCGEGKYGIYTRVEQYLLWILNNITTLPVSNAAFIDFESADLTQEAAFGGDGQATNWSIDSAHSLAGGSFSVRSPIGQKDGTRESLRLIADSSSGDELRFGFSTNMLSGAADYFELYIDGRFIESFTGNHSWWSIKRYSLTPGRHEILWTYIKDSFISGTHDGVWLDNISIGPYIPIDSDGDGLSDDQELNIYFSDPLLPDTDGDGLRDGDEVTFGSNPVIYDTDGDGLNDGAEVSTYHSSPINQDSDNDGLRDDVEVLIHLTNPSVWDSDDDGVGDAREVEWGSDPNDATDFPRVKYDQNADGRADIIWRSEVSGSNWYYRMRGSVITNSQPLNHVALTWNMAGRGDFNGDGKSDLLWRNQSSGQNYIYLMNGGLISQAAPLNTIADQSWQVVSIGDYNGDGKDDILWKNVLSGVLWQYQMNGASIHTSHHVTTISDNQWQIVSSRDIDADGKADIILRHTATGVVWQYLMDGHLIRESKQLMSAGSEWQLVIVGDFDGDKDADLLWRNTNDGRNYLYLLDAGVVNWDMRRVISQFSEADWQAVMAGDFDGDSDDDIVWRHFGDGRNYMYLMDGLGFTGKAINIVEDLSWQVVR
tara:strand:- start:24850 stop:27348 length:2499 start_codon:yes stop_codon:yes gene_type:complete